MQISVKVTVWSSLRNASPTVIFILLFSIPGQNYIYKSRKDLFLTRISATPLLLFPSANFHSISAGVLLSEGTGASLSSGGDHSLGPAFRHRHDSRGRERGGLCPTRHSWHISGEGGTVNRSSGSRAGRGRCSISGRPLVYLCAVCSSLCSILLGYDVGVMSGAKEFIQPNLCLSSVQVVSEVCFDEVYRDVQV